MSVAGRLLAAVVVASSLVGGVLLPTTPASATTGDKIVIKDGDTKTINGAAIPGVDVTYQAQADVDGNAGNPYPTPDQCDSEPEGCIDVPIHLDVPAGSLKADGYILSVNLSWNPGQEVDNLPDVGSFYLNQVNGYLWQNPPIVDSSKNPSFTSQSNGTDPSNMTAVFPTSRDFNLVLANQQGVNNGYTLVVSLTDSKAIAFNPSVYGSPSFGGTAPGGYGGPPSTGGSTDQSGGGLASPLTGPGAPGGPAPVTAPNGPAAAAPIVVPNIAGGTVDPSLVRMSDVVVLNGLGAKPVSVNSVVATGSGGSSSGLAVLLELLALPVLALVLLLLLLLRRRQRGGVRIAAAGA